jgi:hypothetical protein
MMSSEFQLEDIAMVTLEKVLEDACKAFKEHRRAAEECWRVTEAKEFQEFLTRSKNDQQDVVTKVKQDVPPPFNNTADVTRNVSTSSPQLLVSFFPRCLLIITKTWWVKCIKRWRRV